MSYCEDRKILLKFDSVGYKWQKAQLILGKYFFCIRVIVDVRDIFSVGYILEVKRKCSGVFFFVHFKIYFEIGPKVIGQALAKSQGFMIHSLSVNRSSCCINGSGPVTTLIYYP